MSPITPSKVIFIGIIVFGLAAFNGQELCWDDNSGRPVWI